MKRAALLREEGFEPRPDGRRAMTSARVSPRFAVRGLLRLLLRLLVLLRRRALLFIPLLSLLFLGSAYSSSRIDVKNASRLQRLRDAVPRAPIADIVEWAQVRLTGGDEEVDFEDDDSLSSAVQLSVIAPAEPELAQSGEEPARVGKPRRRDGLALIKEGRRHPIPGLIRRAKKKWAQLKARQSKTFAQAVAEYRDRYGRLPPHGFDQWYAFARENEVQLIDEFDMIERDLRVFRALSPESIQARVNHMEDTLDYSWGVNVTGGKAFLEGELRAHDRAKDVAFLMRRFLHHLPDMRMWFNGHDNARVMIPWEERSRLEQLIVNGEYDDEVDDIHFAPKARGPLPYSGVKQVCDPTTEVRAPGFEYGEASRSSTGLEMNEKPDDAIGTVIDSFKRSLDICNSPRYRHAHAVTSWVYPHWPTALLPLFTPGVHGHYNDIHSIICPSPTDEEPEAGPAWKDRPYDRLLWRGQTSGSYWDKKTPWINSHRSRLHLLALQQEDKRNITITDRFDIARAVEVPNYLFNPLSFDVGMVGPPVQCASDGTCEEMERLYKGFLTTLPEEEAQLYKYVLDVDGNSRSEDFRRLMLSNAAVLKATIFAEPFTDWLMPWLHYIPISSDTNLASVLREICSPLQPADVAQTDYSDLHDVMAFFRGGLRSEGAHDHLAREIAQQGRQWALEHLRYEDLEVYQFRLCLEWARLWNGSGDLEVDESGPTEPEWAGQEGV